MTHKTKKLEISPEELDVILDALETQTKILGMQAGAGGAHAGTRLNEVKRVLATVSAKREANRPRTSSIGWLFSLWRVRQAT